MGKVSIIIPAYNEEKRIGGTLESNLKFFKELKRKKILDFEIIVVVNGSTDRTIDVVKSFAKKNKELKYLDLEEGGKGLAITEGFKEAFTRKNDLIGFVDADLATKPEDFYELVKNIENYHGIIASRGKKGAIVKTSFTRKLTNRGFNFVVRLLLFLPYKDTQCGAKLFTRETISEIVKSPPIAQWTFDVDLLYKLRKKGFQVREIPTIWTDIEGSKTNLIVTPIKMFFSVIRLRLIYSPLKFVVKIYDKLPEKIKIHG